MAQARRNRKNKTPAWVWVVIGILLGFFFSHVDFLQAYRFLEASIEKSQKAQHGVTTGRHAQKEETKFDFYNILSERSSDHEGKLHLDDLKEPKPDRKTQASNEIEEPPQKKRVQAELSDLDAVTQKRIPPLDKRSTTQLPSSNKQGKQEISELAQPAQLQKSQKAQLELPKGKISEEKKPSVKRASRDEKETRADQENKPNQSEKFTLQIAALRSYSEADRLKAQLLLLGFQGIHIKKISKGQEIWFRVTVGNYSSRKDAESAKRKLQQNSVNGLIVPQ